MENCNLDSENQMNRRTYVEIYEWDYSGCQLSSRKEHRKYFNVKKIIR